jgi:hypothetical protein
MTRHEIVIGDKVIEIPADADSVGFCRKGDGSYQLTVEEIEKEPLDPTSLIKVQKQRTITTTTFYDKHGDVEAREVVWPDFALVKQPINISELAAERKRAEEPSRIIQPGSKGHSRLPSPKVTNSGKVLV